MMDYLYVLLISLVNNLDTVGVRVAYSVKGIRIPLYTNLWITMIAFLFSAVAALFGNQLANLLPGKLVKVISMALLVLIGCWLIIEPYYTGSKKTEEADGHVLAILADPSKADRDGSKEIDFMEASFLGIALSLNNIGGGVTAGVLGFSWFLVALLSAVFSFLVLQIGNELTYFLEQKKMVGKVPLIAGFLLILIGIRQIF
ncbi:MAG: sporulation membrane protein YtaF [Bacillota bacterium]